MLNDAHDQTFNGILTSGMLQDIHVLFLLMEGDNSQCILIAQARLALSSLATLC